jgi:hypothetical protein
VRLHPSPDQHKFLQKGFAVQRYSFNACVSAHKRWAEQRAANANDGRMPGKKDLRSLFVVQAGVIELVRQGKLSGAFAMDILSINYDTRDQAVNDFVKAREHECKAVALVFAQQYCITFQRVFVQLDPLYANTRNSV